MSGISKLSDLAAECGWNELSRTPHRVVFYKWEPNYTRIEVCVTTDALGRIGAVTLWRNQRQEFHQSPGVRRHAERLLVEQ